MTNLYFSMLQISLHISNCFHQCERYSSGFSHCSRTLVKRLLFRKVGFQPPFRQSSRIPPQSKRQSSYKIGRVEPPASWGFDNASWRAATVDYWPADIVHTTRVRLPSFGKEVLSTGHIAERLSWNRSTLFCCRLSLSLLYQWGGGGGGGEAN